MSQLKELSKPFHDSLVERKPGGSGGDYVKHSVVVERALATVGPYSLTGVELIRGYAAEEITSKGRSNEKVYPAQDNVVVGALVTIRCTIDGCEVSITEAGDVENPLQKGNDGSRAKDAISDGVKRCFMRVGLGLHLWSRDNYVLDKVLERNEKESTPAQNSTQKPAQPPEVRPATPAENSTQTPTQPARDEVLGVDNGDKLFRAIQQMGFSRVEIYGMSDLVCEAVGATKVTQLGSLTENQAKRLMGVVKRSTPAKAKTKAPWESWSKDYDALNYASELGKEHGIFADGDDLMAHFNAAKDACQKANGNLDHLYKDWQAWVDEAVATRQNAA